MFAKPPEGDLPSNLEIANVISPDKLYELYDLYAGSPEKQAKILDVCIPQVLKLRWKDISVSELSELYKRFPDPMYGIINDSLAYWRNPVFDMLEAEAIPHEFYNILKRLQMSIYITRDKLSDILDIFASILKSENPATEIEIATRNFYMVFNNTDLNRLLLHYRQENTQDLISVVVDELKKESLTTRNFILTMTKEKLSQERECAILFTKHSVRNIFYITKDLPPNGAKIEDEPALFSEEALNTILANPNPRSPITRQYFDRSDIKPFSEWIDNRLNEVIQQALKLRAPTSVFGSSIDENRLILFIIRDILGTSDVIRTELLNIAPPQEEKSDKTVTNGSSLSSALPKSKEEVSRKAWLDKVERDAKKAREDAAVANEATPLQQQSPNKKKLGKK